MFGNVPKELQELKQWVLWVRVPRGNKDAKVPYQANGFPARTNDSRTWCSFDDAVATYEANSARYSGIGFVFTDKDEYCGIDLDYCIDGGVIDEWAKSVIERFGSYTEYSPSGNGIHVLAKGKKPTDKCKKGKIEIYECGRYFTVTGQQIGETTSLKNVQTELNSVCKETF